MIKHIYFAVLIVFATNMVFAQFDYDDGYLYMKCGTKLGKKSELVDDCAKKFPTGTEGAVDNKYKLCECVMETIANNYTYKEFEKLLALYGKDWPQMIIIEGNSAVVSELEDCVLAYMNEDYDLTKNEEQFTEGYMISCIKELENNPDLNDIDIDILAYCDCTKEKLLQRGFALSDLSKIEDQNSILFNEVMILCLNKSGVLPETLNNANDVTGSIIYASTPLISIGGIFKVKVSFGNLSKYFIIDSGASDTFISLDFERDLILEDIVQKENYLTDEYYTLADGSIIKCRRILLNNVIVGHFTVNNVVVVVVENSDINLLLGKSFLDKFKNWSIDNENSKLYLERK